MVKDKISVFEKELAYIKEEEMREDAKLLLLKLPDYFFEIPASSTGKYHPEYALGEGGLVRHTKAAMMIAKSLLEDPCIGDKYTKREQDIMLMALMIHDGLKSGREHSKYTKVEHPLLIGEFVREHEKDLHLKEEEVTLLCNVLASHMGPWNKDFNGKEALPVPKTKYENFVHMCDYLASRKTILVPFDDKDNIVY